MTTRSNRPLWLTADLERIEDLLLKTAGASENSLVSETSTHLLRAGGKRIRPTLVVISSRAGREVTSAGDLAAAAVELVHLATLYHDDVIDQTDTRRGVPTAHSKWGSEIAVLAGDYLFARACELGAEAGGEVPRILSRALADVCEGQIAEMEAIGDTSRPVEHYLETIRRKTAALFSAACELGAATSKADPEVRAALVSYGENLGVAFQIIDDLLDLIGDVEVIGKRPGTDLKEGVYTLPVLLALQSEPSLRDHLVANIDLDRVLGVLSATGATAAAVDRAESYCAMALQSLAPLTDSEWKAALTSVVADAAAQIHDPLKSSA